MKLKILSTLFYAALLSSLHAAPRRFDVVVYGGTSGGVITAVAAAREGAGVVLLEPGTHLGGMTSGGLGWTDYGKKETVGGYSLEFYKHVGRYYGQDTGWFFEPHVAEAVLRRMAAEAGVEVIYGQRLREKGGVLKTGSRITEIRMESGAVFTGRIFADCTYEGDLMAQAGVSYVWGREGTSQYSESLAGVRPKDRNHTFDVRIAAIDEHGKLLPEVQSAPRGDIGAADLKVQAYNFRMCLSSDPDNQTSWPRPRNYDPSRYKLLAKLIDALTEQRKRPPVMNELMHVQPMPNNKTDINNSGAFSTDYIGKNWDYPEATYARRRAIWQDHIDYMAGFFYFLAWDPRVPESLRREMKTWGLARDEFTDTNNWPHQLYVREARRMVGDFVMSQKDIQKELSKEDVIGMGSYNSDSHNVQRHVTEDGAVQNEGNMEVPVTPYQIPYRVVLPRRQQADNLLVPVCLSASHVVYSTLRMEPVYMILGHAAGVAAKMAIDGNVAVQDIDARALTEKLRGQGAVMEWK